MNTKRLFLKQIGTVGLIPALISSNTTGKESSSVAGLPQESYFPNVSVTTHEGKVVHFYDDLVKDKVVIINAMYTVCTNVCPTNTANLRNLQASLGSQVGKDVYIYSITLQPEIDDASALKAYAKKYGAGPGWTFLTGKRKDIEVLRRKLGFYDSDPVADADLSNHAGIFRIGNDRLGRWMMVPATTPTPQVIVSVRNMI